MTALHCGQKASVVALLLFAVLAAPAAERACTSWGTRCIAAARATSAQWRRFAWLLVYVSVFYFYRLGHFTPSIDDEMAAFRGAPTVWILQGRWLTFWLERCLVRQPTLPFLPEAGLCVALSLTYAALLRSFALNIGWRTVLLFPLFVAHPVFLVLGEFAANVLPTIVGLLFSAVAVQTFGAFLEAPRWGRAAVLAAGNTLALACAIACYQSFLLFYLSGASIALFLVWGLRVKASPRRLLVGNASLLVSCLLGCLTYYGVQKAHLHLYVDDDQMAYIDSFLQLQRLGSEPFVVVRAACEQAWQMYTGAKLWYGVNLVGLLAIVVLGLAALIDRAVVTGPGLRAWVLLGLGIQVVLAPYALNFTGGAYPTRVYVALPLSLWFLGYLALTHRLALLRGVAAVTLCFCTLQQLFVVAHYNAASTFALERDKALAAAVYQALAAAKPDFSPERAYEVEIFGSYRWRASPYAAPLTGTTDASFFNWDNGNPGRMVSFMQLLGYGNLQPVSSARRQEYAERVAQMPSWPRAGCVAWVGETALIKLGDVPGLQY